MSTVMFWSDYTKKMKAKIAKAELRENIMQAQQAESYTANISHEMRTPIGSTLFFLQTIVTALTQRYGDTAYPELEKYLTMMEGQLRLMQTFVNDLIDIRRLKSGGFHLNLEPFNVQATLTNICSVFRYQAEAKGTTLSLNLDQLIKPFTVLVGDQRRFTQVVTNLIKNALKFTVKGRIDIIASYDWPIKMFQVEVSDTGIGIEQKDLPKLFNPFG